MPICFAIMVIFQKNFIFLKMAIIWLQLTEISLKFESSSQKLFDFNRLKIVDSKGVCPQIVLHTHHPSPSAFLL
jgi:hypothetical protein